VCAVALVPPSTSLRRVVVGTAGHIDHGKTLLVKTLTGIDCDRWAEEKTRGITIDLGFAYLRHEDLQIGFIDVPGHERFVHNALAGLGGIRIVLLVVAADEGVMPQTREHLAICSLLGIPTALVVLTKKDLVSPDLLELAELEVLELLEGTPFAAARVVRVSSLSGEGIAELKANLFELAARFEVPPEPGAPVRLPVDRAFHLRGLGVLVTGTLANGAVRVGDVLEALPARQSVRVRSIQVHGETREEAAAGERTSLQLTGASLEDLERGVQLVTPGCFEPSLRLCARMQLLADAPDPLRGAVPVRFHLLASECMGTLKPLSPRELKPGESGFVEIHLGAPVAIVSSCGAPLPRPRSAAAPSSLRSGVVPARQLSALLSRRCPGGIARPCCFGSRRKESGESRPTPWRAGWVSVPIA
jgi:selenocysteine-specific elongation factor